MDVTERLIPGIPEVMRIHMMKLTRRSMLNRGVAGIRGETVIVNLPGKAGAAKECLSYLLEEITHAVEVVKGEA